MSIAVKPIGMCAAKVFGAGALLYALVILAWGYFGWPSCSCDTKGAAGFWKAAPAVYFLLTYGVAIGTIGIFIKRVVSIRKRAFSSKEN